MKLLAVGDSVTQGFMSFAAARTDLAYPSLIAQQLGLLPHEHTIPEWKAGGLPANIELLFRRVQEELGPRIPWYRWTRASRIVLELLKKTKEHYEKGDGNPQVPYDQVTQYFHNVASWGFTIADSWLVTPEFAQQELESLSSKRYSQRSLVPTGANYRTAIRVLNPSRAREFSQFSQLSWLDYHARREGIENVVLWLGTNNALGTIGDFFIRETRTIDGRGPAQQTYSERLRWNLWRPEHFEEEYTALLDRVDESMKHNQNKNWKVFIGNIPLITICPFIKGIGHGRTTTDGHYFERYTFFPFDERLADKTRKFLTFDQVRLIDAYVTQYNRSITRLVDEKNRQLGRERYVVVDVAGVARELAFKRNKGQPTYEFPSAIATLAPVPTTEQYATNTQGALTRGGLFSLDGVHPGAIGQGIIAREFITAMCDAGVNFPQGTELGWADIIASDTLYTTPLPIVQEILERRLFSERAMKSFELFRQRSRGPGWTA